MNSVSCLKNYVVLNYNLNLCIIILSKNGIHNTTRAGKSQEFQILDQRLLSCGQRHECLVVMVCGTITHVVGSQSSHGNWACFYDV